MDTDESTFIFSGKLRPSCPMGFVTDDQVEGRQVVRLLGTVQDINGLVGGEDSTHMLGIMPFFHLPCQMFWGGCGWIPQFMRIGLDGIAVFLTGFADITVGTDGIAVQGDGAFLCPFGQGLGQEVQAGHQKQDAFSLTCLCFCNLECCKGFAGTARRDELAPVCCCQSLDDRFFRLNLMGAQRFLCMENRCLVWLIFAPINLAVFQVEEVNFADGYLLVEQCFLGIVRPMVCGRDDDAVGEVFYAGCGEEAVDVFFLEMMVGCIEFALDGVVFSSSSCLGNEIDAGILAIQPLGFCPVGIRPDITVQVRSRYDASFFR